jgi:hypothetical protein
VFSSLALGPSSAFLSWKAPSYQPPPAPSASVMIIFGTLSLVFPWLKFELPRFDCLLYRLPFLIPICPPNIYRLQGRARTTTRTCLISFEQPSLKLKDGHKNALCFWAHQAVIIYLDHFNWRQRVKDCPDLFAFLMGYSPFGITTHHWAQVFTVYSVYYSYIPLH